MDKFGSCTTYQKLKSESWNSKKKNCLHRLWILYKKTLLEQLKYQSCYSYFSSLVLWLQTNFWWPLRMEEATDSIFRKWIDEISEDEEPSCLILGISTKFSPAISRKTSLMRSLTIKMTIDRQWTDDVAISLCGQKRPIGRLHVTFRF